MFMLPDWHLHAECPECGEYRRSSILLAANGPATRVILVCECKKEESDAPTEGGRQPHAYKS